MGEANETSVGLEQCVDLYDDFIDVNNCKQIISEYDIIGRQLNKLIQGWDNMKRNNSSQYSKH